jgi:hypothetical protein
MKLGTSHRGRNIGRVLENRVLRKIFRPMRDQETDNHRRLHNEELHALYFSPNNIWEIKPKIRDGRCMWHIWRGEERRGEERCIQGFGGDTQVKGTT